MTTTAFGAFPALAARVRVLPLVVLLTIPCAAGAARSESHARAGAPAPFFVQPASESPAARCAREFIAMVNDPRPENVRNFENTWASKLRLGRASVDERVGRMGGLRDKWGKLTVTGAAETKDKSVVVAASTSTGLWLELNFVMSSVEAGKFDAVEIAESNTPIERKAVTAEGRTQAVQGMADALRTNYVYPDKGAKMADVILGKLKAGEYDAIDDEGVLARQLTDDCRSVTKDMHLGIRVAPERKAREGGREAGRAGGREPDPMEQMRRDNFFFKKVEVLDGNIGYLRFDGFIAGDEANRIASAAMNFLSGCDALIIDMRYNGGGNPEMVAYVTSYLFESKTHLNDMVDREGKIVEEYWTTTDVPGPRPRADVPVYVLSSGRTFSGAEEFCYNLKNLKRATIVGETTGGGAHPVDDHRVNDRFVVRVPFMRAQNPISKTNWEGTGVEPDVQTSAGNAFDKAVELARAAVQSKTVQFKK